MKITKTNVSTNECECGEEVKLKKYIGFPEVFGATEVWKYIKGDDYKYMGFCKCGNTFVREG